ATVTDTSPPTKNTPQGTVSFSSDGAGLFVVSPGTLATTNALDPTAPAKIGRASCRAGEDTGTAKITATQNGDPSQYPSTDFCDLTRILRTTSTDLPCTPRAVTAAQPTTCPATVTDTSPPTKTTPQGTVSFSSDGAGLFVVSPCTLATTNALDPTAPASCSVTYTPTAHDTGTHKITATYDGVPGPDTGPGFFILTVSLRTTSTDVQCTPGS